MGYATEATVTNMVKGMDQTIKSDYMTNAIEFADRRINSQLIEANVDIPSNLTPASTSDTINFLLDAGNLYAAMKIFDMHFISSENRRPTAIQFEKEADDLIKRYIAVYENTTETTPFRTVGTFAYDKDYPDG